MSSTGQGWGMRPWRARQAQPPPEQQQMGLSGPCSPEPWPTSWGCSEPYCTSFVSSSSPHYPFFLKKKKKIRGEGEEEWPVEAGALRPMFLPTSWSPAEPFAVVNTKPTFPAVYRFLMADTGVLPGPLVLAYEGDIPPSSVRCNSLGLPEALAGTLLPESSVCFDRPQL